MKIQLSKIVMGLLCLILWSHQTFAQLSQDFVIETNGKKYVPKSDISALSKYSRNYRTTSSNGLEYKVLQFQQIPNAKDKQQLKANGITVLNYIGGNAYYVSIDPTKSVYAANTANMRSMFDSKYLNKVASVYKTDSIPDQLSVDGVNVKFMIHVVNDVPESLVLSTLNKKGIYRVNSIQGFDMYAVETLKENLKSLEEISWITNILPPAPERIIEDFNGQKTSGLLYSEKRGVENITGAGVHIGIWDGDVDDHIDLGDRVTVQEAEFKTTNHGMHVAGIVGGAGVIDQYAEGFAPEATIESWNFNVGSNGLQEYQEMDLAATERGISITQNSYGLNNLLGIKYPYSDFEYGLDKVANNHPELLHVFAAGNSRGYLGVYNTVSNSAKNILSVANITIYRDLNWSSSFGPGHGGVLLPHIASHGTDVLSLGFYNEYLYMTGTSMSCPAVSGAAAVLTEKYRAMYGNSPRSALLKGILCNSANDLYLEGPDYYSGFGEMNIDRAISTLETGKFFTGEVDNEEEVTFNFVVPANQADLKVMLTWLDPESNPTLSTTLINDLDIEVIFNGEVHEPLVLDKYNPDFVAKPGKDRLNNIEQVVIKEPKAGRYTVKVKGYKVPMGPQEFFVNYVTTKDDFEIIYPFEGETLVADAATLIRWNSTDHDNQTDMYYAEDGINFSKVYTSQAGSLEGILKPSNVYSEKAKLRLIQGGKVREVNIKQMHRPETPIVEDHGNYGTIQWGVIPGASHYEVLKYNGKDYEVLETVDATKVTTDIYGSDRNAWYAVRAINQGHESESKRSFGTQLQHANNITSDNTWPIEIDFESPNQFVVEKSGEYASAFYGSNDVEFFKSKVLLLTGILPHGHPAWVDSDKIPDSDEAAEELFGLNPEFIASGSVKIAVPATLDQPVLHFNLIVPSAQNNSAFFRLNINGAPVGDAFGKVYHQKDIESDPNAWHEFNDNYYTKIFYSHLYYDLSAYKGQTIDIDFEGVCRAARAMNRNDYTGSEIKIDDIKFEDGAAEKEITLAGWSSAKSGLGELEQELYVKFVNTSKQTINNAKVTFEVTNQEGVIKQKVEEEYNGALTTAKGVHHTFKTPLSITELDDSYSIKYTVEGDGFLEEGTFTGVDRYNEYFRAGSKMYGGIASPPLVDGELIVTTNGGRIYPYSGNQAFGNVFTSKDASKRLQIQLTKLNLNEEDSLFILDGYYGHFNREKIIAEYGGTTFDQSAVMGNMPSGDLTVIYICGPNSEKKEGFEFIVKEIDKELDHDLAVSGIYPSGDMYKYHSLKNKQYSVHFRVANNGSSQVESFTAKYYVDGEFKAEQTFTSPVKPSYYNDYMFEERLDLFTAHQEFDVKVEIVSEDENMDNNIYVSHQKVENPIEPSTMPDMFISKISIGDYYFNENNGQPDHSYTNDKYGYQDFPDKVFDFTYGEQKELEVILEGPIAGAGTPVGYIDWDDDGFFSEEEKMIMYKDPAFEHRYYGYIKPETIGGDAGLKKLRISLISDAFMGSETAQDFRINLHGEPFNHDVALDYIDAPTQSISGDAYIVKVGVMEFIHEEETVDIKLSAFDSYGTEVYTETVEGFTFDRYFGQVQMIIPHGTLTSAYEDQKYIIQAEVIHPEDKILENNIKQHEVVVSSVKHYMFAADSYNIYRWQKNNPSKKDRITTYYVGGPTFASTAYVYNLNNHGHLETDGNLYALASRSSQTKSSLLKVGISSGISTNVTFDIDAFDALGFFNIAYDVHSDQLYGFAKSNDKLYLYTLSTMTAEASLVTEITMPEGGRIAGVTFDFDGTCYLLDGGRSELQTMNIQTGEVSIYHRFEDQLSYSQGISFDKRNGQLYIQGNKVLDNGDIDNIFYRFDFQEDRLIPLYTAGTLDAKQLMGMSSSVQKSRIDRTTGLLSFHVEGEIKTVINDKSRREEIPGIDPIEGDEYDEKQKITTYLPVGTDISKIKVYAKAVAGGFMASYSPAGKLDWGKEVNLNDVKNNMLVTLNTFNNSSSWTFEYVFVDPNVEFDYFDLQAVNNPALEEDITGTIQASTITLDVPKGVDISGLIPSFETGSATEVMLNNSKQISDQNMVDFSEGAVYTLVDTILKTEKLYVVKVNQEENSEAELFTFEITPRFNAHLTEAIKANIEDLHLTLDLAGVEQQDQLVPSFTVSPGAYLEYKGDIYGSGEVPFDFTELTEFAIVSEDGANRTEYTIDTKLSLSDAAEFISWTITSEHNEHIDEDISFSIEETVITADLSDFDNHEMITHFEISDAATLHINDEEVTSTESVINFKGLEKVHITAEDGTEVEYTFDIKLEKSNAANLISMAILSEFNPSLSSDIEGEIDDETITFDFRGVSSIADLKADFEVSEFASLYQGEEELEANVTSIDFTKITELKVVAEDLTEMIYAVEVIVDEPTSIGDHLSNNVLYPNPSKGKEEVTLKVNGKFNWELFNLTGQSLEKGEGTEAVKIKMSTLRSGTYIVMIYQEGNVTPLKLIKN
ncbi:S8 family serine peptidase [Flammeovirga sp. MY04]|uniref:S8 family peptidase n=1 Tax=Flammeovirga sp. MY04 TaxID=1191459 RepID=UPI00080610DC|nr:S8 family peptidase [Flammeovirga sp. MY04]ANQ51858.1 S8 family serine peptidase [Flammeovirga sp. MY04]